MFKVRTVPSAEAQARLKANLIGLRSTLGPVEDELRPGWSAGQGTFETFVSNSTTAQSEAASGAGGGGGSGGGGGVRTAVGNLSLGLRLPTHPIHGHNHMRSCFVSLHRQDLSPPCLSFIL